MGREPRRSQYTKRGGSEVAWLAATVCSPLLQAVLKLPLTDDAQLSYSPETASCSRPLHQQPVAALLKHPWEAVAVIIATLTRGALLSEHLSGEPFQQPGAAPEITEGHEGTRAETGKILATCLISTLLLLSAHIP